MTWMLTKIIPARRKTVHFNWIKSDWMKMSKKYREVRQGMTKFDFCFWCRHNFEDGESMTLANTASPGSKNVLMCVDCTNEALKGGK